MCVQQFRRRREGKTDYRARLRMVKSGEVRLVIRKSLSHMNVQFIAYRPAGDATLATASSTELAKYGWACPTGNLPAAYLTGLLAGLRGLAAGIRTAVSDIGVAVNSPGSRCCAALKGAIDSGIAVAHSPDILPAEERITGAHIAQWAGKAGRPAFAMYKTSPAELPKHFNEVKQKIISTKGAKQ